MRFAPRNDSTPRGTVVQAGKNASALFRNRADVAPMFIFYDKPSERRPMSWFPKGHSSGSQETCRVSTNAQTSGSRFRYPTNQKLITRCARSEAYFFSTAAAPRSAGGRSPELFVAAPATSPSSTGCNCFL